jgi:hypothetical protein
MVRRRGSVFGGLILILAGLLFLALEMSPGLAERIDLGRHWPLIIIAVGGLFLLTAFAAPPLAIPGALIGGIGSLLYYQNLTNNWESWAYAWALIPAFAGLGLVFQGLLGDRSGGGVRHGGRLILIGLILFAVFGIFFAGWLDWGVAWPLVLVLIGAWLLLRDRRRK